MVMAVSLTEDIDMGFETFPKNGGKSFDTVEKPAGWDDHDNSKRGLMKTGRNKYCKKAADNYKVNVGKEAPGNAKRREYMKSGNKAQAGFGTGA
jgi:hypothetical protein